MNDEMNRHVNSMGEVRRAHNILEKLKRPYQINVMWKWFKDRG
jgi:hypothetical protein